MDQNTNQRSGIFTPLYLLFALMGFCFRILLLIAGLLLIGSIVAFFGLKSMLSLPKAILPNTYAVGKGVSIFDRYNHFVCTVYADKDCQPVPLAKISPNLRLAVLAAEDHHFYEHHGVDPIGIMRALKADIKARQMIEGGSTITQQLARNLFLDPSERSLKRKISETILAIDLENTYPKDRILESYLNDVYFGSGVYGAERAAQSYFSKHASQLSIGEAAFLAGLIRAPSDLGQQSNRTIALVRQREVLSQMGEYGYISNREAKTVGTETLVFKKYFHEQPYPYFVSYVVQLLKTCFTENQLWQQGLRVYTTLDPEAQETAERIMNRDIRRAPVGVNQGALVCLSLRDGSLVALVGGVGNYRYHQWNSAIYPHTAGSAFKPFVYLAALINRSISLDSVIDDSPVTVGSPFNGGIWSPKNFDGRFLGNIPVSRAFALSRNVCAVKIASMVGIDNVIKVARGAGITSRLDAYLPLALGSCAVSPLEMAAAYGTFARGGNYVAPFVIRALDDGNASNARVFQPRTFTSFGVQPTAELLSLLVEAVQNGTGGDARLPGIAVAGKTGTADESRDIWFVGFTPDTVCAVWGGNDQNLPVKGHNVTGGSVMAGIWKDYISAYYQIHPPIETTFALLEKIPPSNSSAMALSNATKNYDPKSTGKFPLDSINGPSLLESDINQIQDSPKVSVSSNRSISHLSPVYKLPPAAASSGAPLPDGGSSQR
jgi:penicillin-binding protein 1A